MQLSRSLGRVQAAHSITLMIALIFNGVPLKKRQQSDRDHYSRQEGRLKPPL